MKKRFLSLLIASTLILGACGLNAENGGSGASGNENTQNITGNTPEITPAQPTAPDAKGGRGDMEIAANNGLESFAVKESIDGFAYDSFYYEDYDFNTEEYNYNEENKFLSTKTSPFSTFSADVDTASYANLRRQVFEFGNEGIVPDSIRIEEMINYFRYDYAEPTNDDPFGVTTEIYDCPWNEDTKLLLIGLQAKKMNQKEMPKSNFVFLVDISGSMDEPNKLPLVQRSFLTLVENLDEEDTVSIVTYASGEEIIIEGAKGSEKTEIMSAIENLYAGGSTNGESAIQTAYELAEKYYIEGGNNRIIMATDGDFNVGITSEGELTRLVQEKAKTGVFISVLGYGMGNYKDNKLEAIADNGNGNYYYIDDIAEARKVLIEEAGGTLFTVAKDVKLQVEFNPEKIKGYRLVGYENRLMNAEDFANDEKDGGEIGAGHQVTCLYELVFADSDMKIDEVESRYKKEETTSDYSDEYLIVNIRYKKPDGDKSILLQYPVDSTKELKEMSDNMKWTSGVAQVGMLLTESEFAGTSDYDSIKEMIKDVANDDYKEEFIYLINRIKNK